MGEYNRTRVAILMIFELLISTHLHVADRSRQSRVRSLRRHQIPVHSGTTYPSPRVQLVADARELGGSALASSAPAAGGALGRRAALAWTLLPKKKRRAESAA